MAPGTKHERGDATLNERVPSQFRAPVQTPGSRWVKSDLDRLRWIAQEPSLVGSPPSEWQVQVIEAADLEETYRRQALFSPAK